MKRELFAGLLLLGGSGVCAAEKQPNIVMFFVDDLGWGDLGYLNQKVSTPNIDKLKGDGLYFSRAYIPTPTSSPSRTSMLTGKEAVRVGMVRHIPDAKGQKYHLHKTDPAQMPSINYLPLEEITYAERLKEYGYYNMFVGKWHLGEDEKYFPINQGFDDQYGASMYGHPKNYYHPFWPNNNPLKSICESGDYITDVLTRGAERFILEYEKPQPFMLSFWYYTVHSPHIGRDDLVAKYKGNGLTGRDAEYAAMVTTLDESVGRVMMALEQRGIADNTVIILTSDQGGAFDNSPLSGGKLGGNTLGEGGSRVPFMISYPGVTSSGAECDTPIQTIDVFPTLIEIASGRRCRDKQIQGVSLVPLLKGRQIADRNLYFYRSYEDQYCSVLNGDWKLIKYRSGEYRLYNLETDLSETKNLVGTSPKMFNRLKKELNDWEAKAVHPDIR